MRKIIVVISILCGVPLTLEAQNEMYFFSTEKKEEPQKVLVQKKATPKKQTTNIYVPSGSTVVISENQLKHDALDQYNRRGQVVVDGDNEYEYVAPSRGGEWLYDGFEGSYSDYSDAERAIRSRDRRYSISISSPYYWDVVYGLNSWDWNIYVDNWDAYIFPRFSNPFWSNWRFGSRSGFGFSLGYNSWNSWSYPYSGWDYWGYNPGYYWGWSGWGHGHGYYPHYWHGGWGGGGYYPYYTRGRRSYRDNRRYDGVSNWSTRSNRSSRGGTTRDYNRTSHGQNTYYPSNSTRNRGTTTVRSNTGQYVGTSRDIVRPTVNGQSSNNRSVRSSNRYLDNRTNRNTNDRSVRFNNVQNTTTRNGVRVNSGTTNRSSIRYTRPSSTRSNTTRNRSVTTPRRSNTNYNNSTTTRSNSRSINNSSRSSRTTVTPSRSTTRSTGSSYRSSGGSSRSSGGSSRSTRTR